MKKQIEKSTFILGIIIIFISIIIPYDSLEKILGKGLRPLGLATLYICPVLGLIGMIYSIKNKNIPFIILNIILILSFPITTFLGYLIY